MLENILPTNAYIIGLKLFTIIYMTDSKMAVGYRVDNKYCWKVLTRPVLF